jgi:hypothetical protein
MFSHESSWLRVEGPALRECKVLCEFTGKIRDVLEISPERLINWFSGGANGSLLSEQGKKKQKQALILIRSRGNGAEIVQKEGARA